MIRSSCSQVGMDDLRETSLRVLPKNKNVGHI